MLDPTRGGGVYVALIALVVYPSAGTLSTIFTICFFVSPRCQRPIAVRLAIMLSSAYAINFIFKRIPHSLEQRHTKRRQCLCQFAEEFLSAYLPCIRQEGDVNNLKHVFIR